MSEGVSTELGKLLERTLDVMDKIVTRMTVLENRLNKLEREKLSGPRVPKP